MNYDFFADGADKIRILDFIFMETNLEVFDLSSNYGEEISKYTSTAEIRSKFDLLLGDQNFNLWSPDFRGKILFRKIELDPKRCQGHTFRYSTDGWGLIQLYFKGYKNNELKYSHLGHFNEKGALKSETINVFNGKVSDWDWKEIQRTSAKLKRAIQSKLVVKRSPGLDILEAANALKANGVKLQGEMS